MFGPKNTALDVAAILHEGLLNGTIALSLSADETDNPLQASQPKGSMRRGSQFLMPISVACVFSFVMDFFIIKRLPQSGNPFTSTLYLLAVSCDLALVLIVYHLISDALERFVARTRRTVKKVKEVEEH